ncbi:MAG: ChbG/HpnK family deacetylase [Synechococcus sp.]
MVLRSISTRIRLYSLVGVVAAAVHAGVLLGLRLVMPVWVANPLAFLAASLAGYLGHARFTFRPETGGTRFAKRWLVVQYAVNLSVCSLMPLAMPAQIPAPVRIAVLVFTPTVLNALIWSRAARFSQRRRQSGSRPRLHADDLGLSKATNEAILALIEAGQLDGASLLVQGAEVEPAVLRWQDLQSQRSDLHLCLHLCLTEGPCSAPAERVADLVNANGHLHLSFGQWLLMSLLPPGHPRRRRISHQLRAEISAQIDRFHQLLGRTTPLALDGHQHIHLVPLVHDTLLNLAQEKGLTWMRSTAEPLPTGLPLRSWSAAIRSAGLLKWSVLQLLTSRAAKRQRNRGIASNNGFAGVLFTGQMGPMALKAGWRELSSRAPSPSALHTPPQLLVHPGAQLERNLQGDGFGVSAPFAGSRWRQREWDAVRTLNR